MIFLKALCFFKAFEFGAPYREQKERQRIERISRWILSNKEVASQGWK